MNPVLVVGEEVRADAALSQLRDFIHHWIDQANTLKHKLPVRGLRIDAIIHPALVLRDFHLCKVCLIVLIVVLHDVRWHKSMCLDWLKINKSVFYVEQQADGVYKV